LTGLHLYTYFSGPKITIIQQGKKKRLLKTLQKITKIKISRPSLENNIAYLWLGLASEGVKIFWFIFLRHCYVQAALYDRDTPGGFWT
jgi:hypothetical protein